MMYDPSVSAAASYSKPSSYENGDTEDIKYDFHAKNLDEFLSLDTDYLSHGISDLVLCKVIKDARLNAKSDFELCFGHIFKEKDLWCFSRFHGQEWHLAFCKHEENRLDIVKYIHNINFTQNSELKIKICWFKGRKVLVWLRCYIEIFTDLLRSKLNQWVKLKVESYVFIKEYIAKNPHEWVESLDKEHIITLIES